MILLVVLLFEDAAFLFGVTSQCTEEVEPDERRFAVRCGDAGGKYGSGSYLQRWWTTAEQRQFWL